MKYVLEALSPLIISIVSALAFVFILRAIVIHIQRPREQRKDTYTPMSPTLQWMNTAGSILLAANKGDFRYMAGRYFPGNENNQKRVSITKEMLWDYWGIDGHESAIETMRDVVNSGMRAQYNEEMQKLETIYSNYSEEQLIEIEKQRNPKADEDCYLPKMLMAYRKYGENALLGWDMGRVTYIIQCCYFAGYVSMEEVLDIGVDAGKKAQCC